MPAIAASDNPFRSACIESLAWRDPVGLGPPDWASALVLLERLGWRGAIVGPHGSGKTTLLDELGRRLSRPSLRVDVRIGVAPPRAPDRILLLDGLERLGWVRMRWWLVRCSCAGMVATLHRDGPLPTWWRTTTTPELLRSLVGDLGGDRAWCDAAFARHGGDVRACLREGYDRSMRGDDPRAGPGVDGA